MKEADIIRLQHMLDAAREARFFAAGHNRNDLDKNRMLTLSLVKEIEIIGEAASKISPEARAELSQFEWNVIIGMRNRLVHIYFDINLDILWYTVEFNLPELIEKLEKLPYTQ